MTYVLEEEKLREMKETKRPASTAPAWWLVHQLAISNDNITADMVNLMEFPKLVHNYAY